MTVPAAAASAVFPLTTGPELTGTVIGSFPQAVIIGLNDSPAAPVGSAATPGPWAVSLLGPKASRVPNGFLVGRLPDYILDHLPDHPPDPAGMPDLGACRPGDRATIGRGVIAISGLRISVVRQWSSRVFRVSAGSAGVRALARSAEESIRGVPLAAVADLERGLAAGETAPAVRALVGLGDGLTPGGDDVLAGLLTALHATSQADLAGLIGDQALTGVLDRTTVLSAELLRLAAAGHACVEALDVLRAIHTGHQLPAALNRLLSIGHTSGADLATGLSLGLGMGLRCGRNMSRYDEASTTTR